MSNGHVFDQQESWRRVGLCIPTHRLLTLVDDVHNRNIEAVGTL